MKNKWFLISLIIIAMVIMMLWIGNRYLYSIGYDTLNDAAIEKTGCQGAECDDEIARAIEPLQNKYHLTAPQAIKCIGAYALEIKDFSFLNPIKAHIVEWIYKKCEGDEVNLDDAHIEIYNAPHSEAQ